MVNPSSGTGSTQSAGQQQEGQAERHLALTYVPARHRPAIAALFALDDALADIVRTTSEPAIGQMRLAWWHDALAKLDIARPPAQPVLQAIARDLLPSGARGSDAAAMIDGWDVLIEEPELDRDALQRFGAGRGGTLFELAARALDPAVPLEAVGAAGSGWALADLAGGLSSPQEAEAARALALVQLRGALEQRWPRALRPLGMLAHFARMDIEQVPAGSPKRLARVLWHRLTGR